jgi:hypothetical protein
VIVTLCSDKGSPGVTTLAVALGLVWPVRRLVLEADPAGGDLAFRMRHTDGGGPLNPDPSAATLAAAVRAGLAEKDLPGYAQPTTLGVPVIPGVLVPERGAPLRPLWPRVADVAAAWPGTVLADIGRAQPGNPALPLARSATCVLLLARASLEGFYHLRDRVGELTQVVGDPSAQRSPLAVVVTGRPRQRKEALAQARYLLDAVGSPIPVAGFLPDDPAGVEALDRGEVTRRLLGTELVRAARSLAETVLGWWPELAVSTDDAAESVAGQQELVAEPTLDSEVADA